MAGCPKCGDASFMGRGYNASGVCKKCYELQEIVGEQAETMADEPKLPGYEAAYERARESATYRYRDPEKRRAEVREAVRRHRERQKAKT